MTGSSYNGFNTTFIIASSEWTSNHNEQNIMKDILINESKPYEAVIIKPVSFRNGLVSPNLKTRSNSVETITDRENSQNSQTSDTTCATKSAYSNNSQQTWLGRSINKDTNYSTNSINKNNNKITQFYPISNSILESTTPISLEENESESITVHGETGFLANKRDLINWSGPLPLEEYPINEDSTPEIIRKSTRQKIEYDQEIAIRYLRPPTPPQPGDIIIKQDKSFVPPPAPPLVIRQQPPRPDTPQPLVIREAPPKPLKKIEPKIITIPGKKIPPPPRKVIIERLPPLPSKPQSIIIERWLPFKQLKRKVVFQKSTEPDAYYEKPRNVIIQWEAPDVVVNKQYKDLGIVRANPDDYALKYKESAKSYDSLPDFAKEVNSPEGVCLASDIDSEIKYDLEGDLHALSLIDLDKEGLGEYKYLINESNYLNKNTNNNSSLLIDSIINDIIYNVKKRTYEVINFTEAKEIFCLINKRLNRECNEEQIEKCLKVIYKEHCDTIDLNTYKNYLENNLKYVLTTS